MPSLELIQDALAGGYPMDLREMVECYLGDLRFSRDPATAGLEEAMRYTLLLGGKRIRPVLSLATARALGIAPARALPLAGAVELVHTLSLIHDDLPAMDNDDVRRGRPANHRVFGEAVAILAGDAMLPALFELVIEGLDAPPERTLRALGVLTRAAGADGMAGGQYLDLTSRSTDPHAILRMHHLKTGLLIEAAVHAVIAIVEQPEPGAVEALATFATEFGLMFQVADDIADIAQDRRQRAAPSIVAASGLEYAVTRAGEHLDRITAVLREAPFSAGELLSIAAAVHRMIGA